MPAPTRREENAAATRDALVEAATTLFAERGYATVSTAAIAEAARVTRGALYHHFSDKKELMRAVFAAADHALVERLTAAGDRSAGPAERLAGTWRAFVDALADPRLRAILFVEAPAALGWQEWRDLDGGRSLELVIARLRPLQEAGELARDRDLLVLAHLVLGALNEAGMLMASARSARARHKVERELQTTLSSMLAPPTL